VRMLAPLQVDVINNITHHELQMGTVRHDLKNQTITGRLILNTLVLNGPVQIYQQINNVKLENIVGHYLSKTIENQVVNAEIIIQGDHETTFVEDVVVHRNLLVENGIVGGVDLALIDQNALKVYGDQHFSGDLTFAAEVAIDLNLN